MRTSSSSSNPAQYLPSCCKLQLPRKERINVNAWTHLLPPARKYHSKFQLKIYQYHSKYQSQYLPFTFNNYDYCIANTLQEIWWTFFSELSSIIENPVQIIQNPALSSWNLALGLISENKKILCKLYKIYY